MRGFGWTSVLVAATLAACGGSEGSGGSGGAGGGDEPGGSNTLAGASGKGSGLGGTGQSGGGGTTAASGSTQGDGGSVANRGGAATQTGGGAGRAGGASGGASGGGLGAGGATGDAGDAGDMGNAGAGVGGDGGPAGCEDHVIAPHHGGGLATRLFYAPSGELHVMYFDPTDHTVRHAVRSGNEWTNTLVARLLSRDFFILDFKVSASGTVHAAYSTGASSSIGIQYVSRTASGRWSQPVTVREDVYAGSPKVAVGVDADDAPYVVHGVRAADKTSRIFVSRPGQTAWSDEAIYTSSTTEDVSSVDLSTIADATGRPWVGLGSQFLVPTSAGYQLQHSTATRAGEFPQFVLDAAATTLYSPRLQGITFGLGSFWTSEDVGGTLAPFDKQPLVGLSASGAPLVAFSRTGNHGDPLYTYVYRRDSAGWVQAASYQTDATVYDAVTPEDIRLKQALLQPVAFDPEGYPTFFPLPDGNYDVRVVETRPTGSVASDVDIKEAVLTNRAAVSSADSRQIVAHTEDGAVRISREEPNGDFVPWGPRLTLAADLRSLTLDPQGHPTLPARDGTAVGVARLIGEAWQFESLTKVADGTTFDGPMGLYIDPDSTTHVFYSSRVSFNSPSVLWALDSSTSAGPVRVADGTTQPIRVFRDAGGALYVYYGPTARWSGSVWQVSSLVGVPYLNADGALCFMQAFSAGGTGSTCLQGGSPVTGAPFTDTTYQIDSVTPSGDGTLYAIAKGTAQSTLLTIRAGKLVTAEPLAVQDPSLVVLADGSTRVLYYDKTKLRLFSRCSP